MLRIDVDHGDPYAIPPDNPFVGQAGAQPEIWAKGLRNPWRYSFDRQANHLYVADVGFRRWEEVNVAPTKAAGLNYGWPIIEGGHCMNGTECDQAGLTLPQHEYFHSIEGGCSVTGGFVYRGKRIPEIQGHYFYSDYCVGWLRSFKYENGQATDHRQWNAGHMRQVVSFGEGGDGELYIVTQDQDRVLRLSNQPDQKGDLSRNEKVDLRDAVLSIQMVVGIRKPSVFQWKLGDVNNDKRLDIKDTVLTLQHVAGLIDKFP